jgi:hypothetical protein
MDEPEYRITDEDRQKTLHYLRVTLPEYATAANAEKLLNYQHAHYKAIEEMYPEEVEKILQNLEDH